MQEFELILMRHGETLWNQKGIWQGHADPPLSSIGLQTIQEASRTLEAEAFTKIISSDLRRCLASAAPLASKMQLPIQREPRLRELDVGDWSGRTRQEIQLVDPQGLARFDRGDLDFIPPGGESRRQFGRRAFAALEEIAQLAVSGELFFVVTHLGILRLLSPERDLSNGECLRLKGAQLISAMQQGREDTAEKSVVEAL